MKHKIPEKIRTIAEALEKAGFEAYLVGGCVRDLLLEREPKDWDITTNATPEEILKIFPHTHYENNFGTVGIVMEDEPEGSPFRVIEITPYRLEEKYSDARHPDKVTFTNKLEEDLKRRDFTINAMAMTTAGEVVDLFDGQNDLKNKVTRAVGDAEERFREDALRMLRAVRFSSQLGFTISQETADGIAKNAKLLSKISEERIKDEFVKIVMSDEPMMGIILCEKLGLLAEFLPELREGIDCDQNKDHIYPVWEHLLRALQNGADKKYPLHVRLSALFHDIGKPRTKRYDSEKGDNTFYGHDVVGAKMVKEIMERLKFDKETRDTVVKLVRWHMFFTDVDAISLSAVRRMVGNVGEERIWELMDVRRCDRIGMGRPKETPYRLRKYESMIEEAMRDPVSVKQLKINGDIMIAEMGMKPGPQMGWILHALLEEVLEDPSKNELEYQKERTLELAKLPEKQLRELGEAGKHALAEEEEKVLSQIRAKHQVK